METSIEKRNNDLNQSMLSVSSRVRTLENRSNELKVKLTECESSCQGVSNLFDQVEKQCKTNTRNIIHFDSRIKKARRKTRCPTSYSTSRRIRRDQIIKRKRT